jgi:site-specific recombinase XerD
LKDAWHIYSTHPDRATPHTVSEQLAYKTTFEEFLSFISPLPGAIASIHEVDPNTVENFASWLKTKSLAVDTHNRKIKRLRKILVYQFRYDIRQHFAFLGKVPQIAHDFIHFRYRYCTGFCQRQQ